MENRERKGTVGRPGVGHFDSLPFPLSEIIASKLVLASFNDLLAIEAFA